MTNQPSSSAALPTNVRYLTTPEYAELARTSPATVRYWRHVKYGPTGFKVGRRVLYAAADVEAWLTALRTGQASDPETAA